MQSFEPGQEVLGKYRVERVLGRGGMGVVLRAVHIDLDTRVAIKVLHGAVESNADLARRFLREAQAASKLKSEFVPRVTDFGRLPDGKSFMVMELLEGEDYGAILTRGPLSPSDAVDAVLQATAALAEAHAAGIVHRDIKPSNLFRTRRPDGSLCVKVLDFGISKIADPLTAGSMTQTGNALGTPFYMSPEQVRAPKDVDERTDIWSLGVVLYEMLSGSPPFSADTMGELIVRILEVTPARLDTIRRNLPPGLADVIHGCLEKDRSKRVSGTRELAELLAPFASGEGALAARRASLTSLPPRDPGPISAPTPSTGGSRIEPVAARSANEKALDTAGEGIGLAETLAASAVSAVKEGDLSKGSGASPISRESGDHAGSGPPTGSSAAEASPRPARARWPFALAAATIGALVLATLAIVASRNDRADAVADPAGAAASSLSSIAPRGNVSGASPAAAAPGSPTPAGPSVEPAPAIAEPAQSTIATAPSATPTTGPSAQASAIPKTASALTSSSIRLKPPGTTSPGTSTKAKPSTTTLW